jgi:microcystin-dependent protein
MLPYIFTLGTTADPDQVNANFAILSPSGLIVGFAGTVAPTGWLLCDGSQVAKATYPDLWALLGTTYGAATSTLFTLPDSRGRTLVGAGQGAGLTNRIIGAIFGEETHLQSQGEMPSHYHSVDPPSTASGGVTANHVHYDGGHAHAEDPSMRGNYSGGSNIKASGSTYWAQTQADRGYAVNVGTGYASIGYISSDHAHYTDIGAFNSGSVGSSTAFNVTQPSFVASYIIKY